MVGFAMTEPVRKWLTLGTRSDWVTLTPRVLKGTVANVPNSLYTGVADTNQSFIFARSEGAFANTFASSYSNSANWNSCNGTTDTASTVRIFYREAPLRPIHNTEATAGRSCRTILDGGGSRRDGHYWLAEPAGSPYLAYCDMTTNGGGWTAVFAGRNGTSNVFGHFDSTSYVESCPDPATRCLRRAPPSVGASASEVAVACGTAMVKFAMTNAVRGWMVLGTQSGWTDLTPTVISGIVPAVPDTLFTGVSSTDQSFVFARNKNAFANTFAASYENGAIWDRCNGSVDRASFVRVFYREAAPTPVHNAPEDAAASCRTILLAGVSQGDGIYWLKQGAGQPYKAYCDMTTAGGGWTQLFAGRNGTLNVFDHFDSTSYAGVCTDPGTRCLQRAPAALGDSATELAVSCGGAAVGFALTRPVRKWLVDGTQAKWLPLTPTVLAGTVPIVPNTLWTGDGASDEGFAFAREEGAFANTFAASYANSAIWDRCNGAPDQTSLVRVLYREAVPTPIHNTEGTAGRSCRAIIEAGGSQGDGIYWLSEPAGTPYKAYCDMTTEGGGWTAVFAGRNGTQNVFDHFDGVSYVGTCTDPATHCLRRPPAAFADRATDFAVSCGGAMVRFALTEPVRNWLLQGTQAQWERLTPTVIAGAVPSVPDTLFTGTSLTDQSFIFAYDQGAFSSGFAASYSDSAIRDRCNGVFDQASMVRIFYREGAATPLRNAPETAGTSCKAIRDALLAASQTPLDGIYWLAQPPDARYRAYCDMTTDGGGWTAVFAGRNGTVNVFDHFDAGAHQGICTDAATRCLRRAPSALGAAGELAVSCGGAAVRFPMTSAARDWLVNGTRSSWITLAPTVIAGSVASVPNKLWTGSASDESFIFAHDQGAWERAFAASYSGSTIRNYCNGLPDAASLVRIFYRE